MQKENTKYSENDIFEGMPSISAVIRSIDMGLSDRKILKILIDKSKKKSKCKEIAFISAKSHSINFELEFADKEYIDSITVGSTHGGIVAICTQRTVQELKELSIIQNGVYFMLDGIEDPYNFGNAVRSLYAAGVNGIILNERNWLGVSGTVARASAGTSELMPFYISHSFEETIGIFKQLEYKVICAGIRDSVSIFESDLSKPLLVVLGGEKRGISRALLELSDEIVRIDYGADFRGSLSASASAAVFGFEIYRYNK